MLGSDLISCSNCWYNALQSGSLGLATGYCVEHEVVLRRADETTCGRHVRKDLMLDSALQQQQFHRRHFNPDAGLQAIETGEPAIGSSWVDHDTRWIRRDPIGDTVADYGELGSKIESLARLRDRRSVRGDIALFNLARGYTLRCTSRGGAWTSGLHLLWWARNRLEEDPEPEVTPQDIRIPTAPTLDRQVEIAQWSIVMLRLTFVSDVGRHAVRAGDAVGDLANLAERAAADTGTLSLTRLRRWVRRTGLPAIERALPWSRYRQLARSLHRDAPVAG